MHTVVVDGSSGATLVYDILERLCIQRIITHFTHHTHTVLAGGISSTTVV
jgi:hypothetical protein